jgi:MiaB-like tRNA modifying enzyme
MPKTERDIIEKINPKASLLGPDSVQKVVDVVKAAINGEKIVCLDEIKKPKLCIPRVRKNSVIHITPVASGCLSNCSYCCVKFARGRLFSYPPELIVEEIKQALKEGCKEIWITSQDNGCYGLDTNTNLPELLKQITKINGRFFIRVGMMSPTFVKNFTKELVEAYKSEKIFKFLHLPVEAGSDRVLKLMKRGYRTKDFLNIVKEFRKEFPLLTLATDIIVGFPGEKTKDFEMTVKLIKEVKPDVVNISKFGVRPGTEAEKMRQLPYKVVKKRSAKLTQIVKKLQLKQNKKWLDWKGNILVDEIGKKGTFIGRNFAYKPVVIHSSQNLLGKFVKVRITDVKATYLIGKQSET